MRDDVLRKLPQRVEGRVGQTDAAVRPEHGDAFRQIVERLALHAHRRGVAAFEIHLLGQVLEHPGDAALGLRVGDDADGASVGQVPPMDLRLDRTIGGKQILLPAPPLRLLGELAFAAQPVDQECVVRPTGEEAVVELPEFLEGLVEEAQLLVLVEDGDRGGELVERVGVAAHHALIFGADRIRLALVDRNARRAFAAGEVRHREDAAVACDHGRQRLVEHRLRRMLPVDRIARLRAEQFLGFAHCGFRVGRLDGRGIGAVDPSELAVLGPDPERHLQCVDQAEHGLVVGGEPLVVELQPRLHALAFGQRQKAHDDVRGALAALHFEWRAVLRLYHQVEGNASLAQRSDRVLERGGGARHQPAAEGEERSALVGRAALSRQRADQLRLLAVVVPHDDALVAQVEQRLGALDRCVEVGDAAAQLDVFGRGPRPLADEEDRRQKCGAHDAGEHRKLHHLDGVEGEQRSGLGLLRMRQVGDKHR